MNRVVFYSILLLIIPNCSFAYQCPLERAYFDEIIYKKYNSVQIVAIVDIHKIEHFKLEDEESSYNLIYAKIVKSWKNEDVKELVIKDEYSMISGFVNLDEGEQYIVYAYEPDENGFYSVDTCDTETLGDVSNKQVNLLDRIKSDKLRISNHYEVFTRVENFINRDLIERLEVESKENSVQVTIELSEYTEDWVKNSVINFIEKESLTLGIENVGNISTFNNKTIIWIHPKN